MIQGVLLVVIRTYKALGKLIASGCILVDDDSKRWVYITDLVVKTVETKGLRS